MDRRIVLLAALSLAAAGAGDAQAPLRHAWPAAPFLFTPLDERAAAFSPDGAMVVYALRIGENYRQVLLVVERHGGHWGTPEVAPFSGLAFDGQPSFSPDGRRLYFASNRDGHGGVKGDLDIWVVERTAAGWGTPGPVRGQVNSPASESGPVETRSGRLYFASSRAGGGDIFVAEPGPDGFGEPRSVGAGVNTADYPEGSPAISPDETIMVFASAARPDQALAPGFPYPRSDLYLSRRTSEGWGPARRLGPAINSHASETAPSFSADGRTFYFVSEHGFETDQQILLTPRALHRGLATARNGLGNVYAIDAAALEERP
jgi:Tol biopolymer transport system component